jgi:aminobenzoyl-glutamate transport protein
MGRFIYFIEKVGNALPHPAILFVILRFIVLVISAIGSVFGWTGERFVRGADGELETVTIEVVNLLSRDGLHQIILQMVTNFTSFAPLGIVMVGILGIGVAENSGLIRATVNYLLVKTPPQLVTLSVVFTGVISSLAVDVGYLLVIPLGGIIFHSLGRHPIAGIGAAFAGVSAGFAANIFIAPLDPMLAAISEEAAQIIDPSYTMLPTAYYFFMVASTFLITIVCTIVTTKWVEPRLGKYKGDAERESIEQPSALELKGLRNAALVFVAWAILISILLIPENGILRGIVPEPTPVPATTIEEIVCIECGAQMVCAECVVQNDVVEQANGNAIPDVATPDAVANNDEADAEVEEARVNTFLTSPVLRGIVPFLFIIALTMGIVYGFTVGKYKKAEDVIDSMSDAIKTLAMFLVLVFFAAQFVAWFAWSNLGALLAINGANVLIQWDIHWIPLVIIFVVFTGFINLFMGSASAKWMLVAPIFIPIFMELGFTPEFAQAVYSVGDSITNIITPLLPYFPLILVFCQKYDKEAGIGTIIATMMPYTIALFIFWTALLIGWVYLGYLGVPFGLGPEGPVLYRL